MKRHFILIILYVLLGALFLIFNRDLVYALFPINLPFIEGEVYLLPDIFLISLVFMLLLALMDITIIGRLKRENTKLKDELRENSDIIDVSSREVLKDIVERLERIEARLNM